MNITSKGIRVDAAGDGNYGTPRGNRKHNGIDYLCDEGQSILAPFDMEIVRVAIPSSKHNLSGIKWRTGRSSGKIFYFYPLPELIGKKVKKGDYIGFAQSVSEAYNNNSMKDHIHFQVDK